MRKVEFAKFMRMLRIDNKTLFTLSASIVVSGFVYFSNGETINRLPPLKNIFSDINLKQYIVDEKQISELNNMKRIVNIKHVSINQDISKKVKFISKKENEKNSELENLPPLDSIPLDFNQDKNDDNKESYTLQGIYISNSLKFALINGKLYFEKQSIDEVYRVESITKDKVCLINNTRGKQCLNLNQQ